MHVAPQSVMIFAAGFGSRMMPLTRDIPKPMISVAGSMLIDRAIKLTRQVGAAQVVCNLHYKADDLRKHLEGSGVLCVEESPDILDTGGGLKNAMPMLTPGPVWTMNPDVVWKGPNPLEFALDAWNAEAMDALLVCINPTRAAGREGIGDFDIATSGQLNRGNDVIYGGVQIIKTSCVAEFPGHVFSLNSVWDTLIAQGRCHGCLYPGHWCDVGHPGGIALAEDMLGWMTRA